MHPHTMDIREFYATPLGRVTARILKQRLRQFWPNVRGENILGMGYVQPYMDYFVKEAERSIIAMSPDMGAMSWPEDGRNLVALTHTHELPLENAGLDRVLVVHHLEMADDLHAVLQEAWRVLEANGRLMLVVPNRTGIWSRRDTTPFGHGRPFSGGQLHKALRQAMFTVERLEHALYTPPLRSRMFLSSASAWERLGQKLCSGLGGVTIVEASKQLFAGMPVDAENKKWKRRRIIMPEAV